MAVPPKDRNWDRRKERYFGTLTVMVVNETPLVMPALGGRDACGSGLKDRTSGAHQWDWAEAGAGEDLRAILIAGLQVRGSVAILTSIGGIGISYYVSRYSEIPSLRERRKTLLPVRFLPPFQTSPPASNACMYQRPSPVARYRQHQRESAIGLQP